jgi:hypothetical protein
MESRQGQFDLGRLQDLEHLFANGVIEQVGAHIEAALGGQSFPTPPVALVDGIDVRAAF